MQTISNIPMEEDESGGAPV